MKRLFSVLFVLILLGSFLSTAAAAPEITAPSALLMEGSTGRVLFEQNAHERLRPASVTKVMTLLLVMEALDSGRISLGDTVTASAAASAKGGSQIYLKEGEQLPLEEVLKSVVVASANDCATALAEHISGSESAFVEEMNHRAAELGLKDTHFTNCTGLDDAPEAAEHLTSAADIARMSRELLKHDGIRKYTTIWMDTVRDGTFGLTNTNKLIRFYEGATGLKTGYTSAAGHCLSASARRDGMELIAVVLHCGSSTDRFESAKSMLNWGFATYALTQPQPEAPLPPVPVVLGEQDTVAVELGDSTPILTEKALKNQITASTELTESAEAPVEQGQVLGRLIFSADGSTVAEVPLVAAAPVPRLKLLTMAARLWAGLCSSEL